MLNYIIISPLNNSVYDPKLTQGDKLLVIIQNVMVIQSVVVAQI